MIPGETRIQAGELVLNEGRPCPLYITLVIDLFRLAPTIIFMRPIPAFNSIERRHEASA